MKPLELWAGPECTVSRVGDRWRDQAAMTGFDARLEADLDRLASLGAACVRLPVLWERSAAQERPSLDWTWSDRAVARLNTLRLPAIFGLLHHGSGPRHTHLLDPGFARRFTDFARRVARRYPQQQDWTPINEPLTTARFSCLYGHWYPHRRDDRSFVRALLNQVQATASAMRAIRAVVPRARLVQTEDLGLTRCTPALAQQAAFDNDRRWLTFDLLCGRVDEHHPLWQFLCRSGAGVRELLALCDDPCPPEVVGINAYVTSERFLDERLALHPASAHGGNGRQRYADVETARSHGTPIDGFLPRLMEAWQRYELPIAITEVHMGCTREEQLRWLRQAWDAAHVARSRGADVRAVTAWAAFGSVDWSSLLTHERDDYEPGLWDARSDPPRLTALGSLARALAAGSADMHETSAGAGWWQRDLRLRVAPYGPVVAQAARGRRLLVVGAGTLGRAFARLCEMRGLPCELLSRQEMDIADPLSVATALETRAPWAVINTAGYVRVDDAERDHRQWRENADGPAVLAAVCCRLGIRFMGFSSDLVFAGSRSAPYVESDTPAPLNAYGRAKVRAEQAVRDHAPASLVIRTAAFFGPWDNANFVTLGLAALRRGEPWLAAGDQVVSPTYVPDLVQAALDLLIDGERGLWHLTNGCALSWADFARRAAECSSLDHRAVQAAPGAELGQHAVRPAFSALRSERGMLLPGLDDALARYLRDCAQTPATPVQQQVPALA